MDKFVYKAKHDYKGNPKRDDVLCFSRGHTFEILSKIHEKWWLARGLNESTDTVVGYVPASYLRATNERIVGKLLPDAADNSEDLHMKALKELKTRVNRAPSDPPLPHDEDSGSDIEELPSPPPRITNKDAAIAEAAKQQQLAADSDAATLAPKKIANPVTASKSHSQINREIKMNTKRGIDLLEKPELQKVLDMRKRDQDRVKKDEESKVKNRTSLECELLKRSMKIQEYEEAQSKQKQEDDSKPEFLKVTLKKRTGSQSSDS